MYLFKIWSHICLAALCAACLVASYVVPSFDDAWMLRGLTVLIFGWYLGWVMNRALMFIRAKRCPNHGKMPKDKMACKSDPNAYYREYEITPSGKDVYHYRCGACRYAKTVRAKRGKPLVLKPHP
jgi:hypothetical protein